MWYSPEVISQPENAPVSALYAKAHLRADFIDDDATIDRLISAATYAIERRCGISLVQQTIDAKCDGFEDFDWLGFGPLISISSVKYVDGDGVEQTLSTDVYEARKDYLGASIVLKYGQSWPSPRYGSQITVRAVVGFSNVPADIVQALLMLVGHWYENREAVTVGTVATEVPESVMALLVNHRRHC